MFKILMSSDMQMFLCGGRSVLEIVIGELFRSIIATVEFLEVIHEMGVR